jgi:hypothetical protein
MNDNPDIVDELNFHAQRAEADERVLRLLGEAAATISRYRMWLRERDATLRIISDSRHNKNWRKPEICDEAQRALTQS